MFTYAVFDISIKSKFKKAVYFALFGGLLALVLIPGGLRYVELPMIIGAITVWTMALVDVLRSKRLKHSA